MPGLALAGAVPPAGARVPFFFSMDGGRRYGGALRISGAPGTWTEFSLRGPGESGGKACSVPNVATLSFESKPKIERIGFLREDL